MLTECSSGGLRGVAPLIVGAGLGGAMSIRGMVMMLCEGPSE